MPTRFPAAATPVPVFISYSHGDEPDASLARALVSELEQTPGNVRFKVLPLDLRPGDVVSDRLTELLKDVKIVLLLVTPAFLAMPQLREQAVIAMRESASGTATLIPVLLTDEMSRDLPFADLTPFRPESWRKFGESSEATAREIRMMLTDLVQARHDKDAGNTSSNTTQETARFYFRFVWMLVAGLAALSLLIALIWLSASPADHHLRYQSPSPLTFFLNSCVIGFAAMSLLQMYRRLFRMRGAFHRDVLMDWLGEAATDELHRVVGAKRIKELLDLPSELLTGQLGAIADQVMEKQGRSEPRSVLVRRMAAEDSPLHSGATDTDQDPRARSALAIQRNLDQFQISASAAWRRYLLGTSILLSMALFVLGLPLLNTGSFIPGLIDLPQNARTLPAAAQLGNFTLLFTGSALTALFAGFLGSIARDLVAIVEKLRR